MRVALCNQSCHIEAAHCSGFAGEICGLGLDTFVLFPSKKKNGQHKFAVSQMCCFLWSEWTNQQTGAKFQRVVQCDGAPVPAATRCGRRPMDPKAPEGTCAGERWHKPRLRCYPPPPRIFFGGNGNLSEDPVRPKWTCTFMGGFKRFTLKELREGLFAKSSRTCRATKKQQLLIHP